MFLKGALICLLAVWFEIDAAKKGKFLKKLAKPNELGYQLEKAVKSNLKDDVSSNNASITSNEEDISTLQDKFDGLQADYNASITSNEEDISTLQDKFDGLQADYNASITSTEEDISNLQDKLDNLQSDYISLQADYNASKGDISTLMDKLDSLQSDYISLRADYNVLKAGIEANNNKIQTNADGILANTNLDTTLADNITSITADISNMDTTLVSQGSRLLDLETMGSGSVWFDAWRTSNFDGSGDWTKITYSYVRKSNAGAMDVGTGVFTAPLAGTYQFIIQVCTFSGGSGAVRLEMDGTIVSFIYDGDVLNTGVYRGTITGTAIVDMQPGQKVSAETVRTLYGDSSYSPIHFTGVLITPRK